jgi:hypothetical protein
MTAGIEGIWEMGGLAETEGGDFGVIFVIIDIRWRTVVLICDGRDRCIVPLLPTLSSVAESCRGGDI